MSMEREMNSGCGLEEGSWTGTTKSNTSAKLLHNGVING